MGKRKLSTEVIKLALEHLTGGLKSASEVAKELCVNKATIFEWRSAYEKYGIEYFYEKETNSTYTKEFKAMVVKEFLNGGISQRAINLKYNIAGKGVLPNWIKWYNEGKDFEDYAPHKGIYLMKNRKVTTEEKVEIVEYCISTGFNYKSAAERFCVRYNQIYAWVQKYKQDNVAGLEDKRGKRKPLSELTEVDKLKRELSTTQRKLEYALIENEVLKKKEEIELRQIFQRPGKK